MTEAGDSSPLFVQNVTAVAGFAYGAIGADIHVFASGQPLYLLASWQAPAGADREWLRELPSRMLNARRAVVPFTGRDDELAQLTQWRDTDPRLTVRWLHGPAGQGKTRLAAEFAADSAAAGWKVVAAFHGPDADPIEPGSHDLTLTGASGVLIIIDYADRWRLTNLTWLLKNRVLHNDKIPARVLMVARTAAAWPAIRGIVDAYQAGTSSQPLPDLSAERGERTDMFVVARDSFAALYGLASPVRIQAPGSLGGQEFGLTLAVHLAALVAVDAGENGERAPADMAGLTMYLLNREQLYWGRVYQDGASATEAGRRYRTPPGVMNRAVFAAALTGALPRAAAAALLDDLRLTGPQQILDDHAVCYPPSDPAGRTVLEPLYPDRLAEDFLALTLPGHRADYPSQGWAVPAVTVLLGHRDGQQGRPAYVSRAVTFLAAAAHRWDHVGPDYLYPELLADPRLGLDAGNAGLTAIASLPKVPCAVLEAIETRLPDDRHVDLDPAIAVLVSRLTTSRLDTTSDLAERARLQAELGRRLGNAGLYEPALASATETLKIRRQLVQADPERHEADLAVSLRQVGLWRSELGQPEDGLAAQAEAVEAWRRLARADAVYKADLAAELSNLGVLLLRLGQRDNALAAAREAAAMSRQLAAAEPTVHGHLLATALNGLALKLSELGHGPEALAVAEEAAVIWVRLVQASPDTLESLEPSLASTANSLALLLTRAGEWERALPLAQLAAEMFQRLVAANPDAFESGLGKSLGNLSMALLGVGRVHDALSQARAAADVYRRLAAARPEAFEADLARSLTNLGATLRATARSQDALSCTREAVGVYRRLAAVSPDAYQHDYATSLGNLGLWLSEQDQREEALAALREAVSVRRRAVQSHPEAWKPSLARELSNLGAELSKGGQSQEALAVAREACLLGRELARTEPSAHRPALAAALANYSAVSAVAGESVQALVYARLAVTTYRQMARENPAHEPGLASSLLNLGVARAMVGRRRKSLAAVREAIALFARLETQNPGAFQDGLMKSLDAAADFLADTGQREMAQSLRQLIAAGNLNGAAELMAEGSRRPGEHVRTSGA